MDTAKKEVTLKDIVFYGSVVVGTWSLLMSCAYTGTLLVKYEPDRIIHREAIEYNQPIEQRDLYNR